MSVKISITWKRFFKIYWIKKAKESSFATLTDSMRREGLVAI